MFRAVRRGRLSQGLESSPTELGFERSEEGPEDLAEMSSGTLDEQGLGVDMSDKDRSDTGTRSRKEIVLHEIRSHPFGYTVLAIFVLAGPALAPLLFPQAPPAAAAIGGLAFGLYAALCAVPQKFL